MKKGLSGAPKGLKRGVYFISYVTYFQENLTMNITDEAQNAQVNYFSMIFYSGINFYKI